MGQGYPTDMNITDGFITDDELNMIQQSHWCLVTLAISNICNAIII